MKSRIQVISSGGCGIVNEGFIGLFSLILLIPIVNSIFDFISYNISKYLIQHLASIDSSNNDFIFAVIWHIFIDFIIALLLFVLVSVSVYYSLSIFFNITINPDCNIINLLQLVDNVKDSLNP